MSEQEYIEKISDLENEVRLLRKVLIPFMDLQLSLDLYFKEGRRALDIGEHRLPTLEQIQGIYSEYPQEHGE